MLCKMFAIYDNKAEYYLNPLTFNTTGESLRNFSDAVNDTQTMLHRHPGDFNLFEIGTYDNLTGQISMHQNSVNLGNALEFIEQETPYEAQPSKLMEHHPNNGS